MVRTTGPGGRPRSQRKLHVVAVAMTAPEAVSLSLLRNHMYLCVADAIKTGVCTEKVSKVSGAIVRLVRN